MATSLKDMLAEANAAVPRLPPQDAGARMSDGDVLILDVRDPAELQSGGKLKGAINVPRGMLEFRADPASPYYDKHFDKDRPVIVYCASGGRSALGGKVLKDLGYRAVYNLGAFKDWAEAGGEVEKPIESGM